MDQLRSFSSADRWQLQVLDEIFRALASSRELSQQLVYKGARVLRLRLREALRASFDIDASLTTFAANVGMASDAQTREQMRLLVHQAIEAYFEDQEPVRYQVVRSTLVNRRKMGPHPRGWDVYWLDLFVQDLAGDGGVPAGQLRIDIAAAELGSERSVSPLELDGRSINAVTLERIAGEKLRAFLSSLPGYRRKIRAREGDRRVKDLYDIVRIARKHPVANGDFWETVGNEFLLACKSRYIDCGGHIAFREGWDETKATYAADKTLPNDVTFGEVEATLDCIVQFLLDIGMIPFHFDLPEIDEDYE